MIGYQGNSAATCRPSPNTARMVAGAVLRWRARRWGSAKVTMPSNSSYRGMKQMDNEREGMGLVALIFFGAYFFAFGWLSCYFVEKMF